ncbi:unnamed protein product, partial [Ixodes pacificus]
KILTDHVKGLTLKPLCDTRWECRVNSLKPVRHHTAELHDALVGLAESQQADLGVRHEARIVAGQLTDLKFLVSIVVWYDILFQVNVVSKNMQCKTKDIVAATQLLKACNDSIDNYRNSS